MMDRQWFEDEPKKPIGVEVHGLRKVFGGRKKVVAVDNVSFNAFQGRSFNILKQCIFCRMRIK